MNRLTQFGIGIGLSVGATLGSPAEGAAETPNAILESNNQRSDCADSVGPMALANTISVQMCRAGEIITHPFDTTPPTTDRISPATDLQNSENSALDNAIPVVPWFMLGGIILGVGYGVKKAEYQFSYVFDKSDKSLIKQFKKEFKQLSPDEMFKELQELGSRHGRPLNASEQQAFSQIEDNFGKHQ